MDAKVFKRTYDADLIPASYESLILGKCVWDPLIGKPHLIHPGMYDLVYEGFVDADLIDDATADAMIEEAKGLKLEEAGLAHITMELELDTALEMQYPKIVELNAKLSLEKKVEISFGDLQARVLNSGLRRKIANLIEELKQRHWKKWDSDFRRLYIITKLYYGSVYLGIDTTADASLEAKVTAAAAEAGIPLTLSAKVGRKVTYKFENSKVPFAMNLEKLKPFV